MRGVSSEGFYEAFLVWITPTRLSILRVFLADIFDNKTNFATFKGLLVVKGGSESTNSSLLGIVDAISREIVCR